MSAIDINPGESARRPGLLCLATVVAATVILAQASTTGPSPAPDQSAVDLFEPDMSADAPEPG